MKTNPRASLLTVSLLAATLRIQAASLTLQPSADTTLFESNPDNSLGHEITFVAGTTAHSLKSRALLQFDLAGKIPAGSVVTAVSLRLQIKKKPDFGAVGSTFELRRALASWVEGTGIGGNTGAAANPGETTWNVRIVPSAPWTQPGGADGTDYAPAISAQLAMDDVGSYTFATTNNLVADAQFWIDHPESNFGWLLRSQSEDSRETARRFASREDPANSPQLTIEYTQGSSPIQLTSIVLSASEGAITWSGGTPPFQLQSNPTLAHASWANLGALIQGQTNRVVFPVQGSQAFYRLLQPATGSGLSR